MYNVIDKVMSLDIGNRGIAHLYEPARKRAGGKPLCQAAAEVFMNLKQGDTVFLLTGSLTRGWVSKAIGEDDGPMGTGTLAGALSKAFNCIPMIFVDELLQDKAAQMGQLAGPSFVTYEEAVAATATPRYTCISVVGTCSDQDELARKQCTEFSMARNSGNAVLAGETPQRSRMCKCCDDSGFMPRPLVPCSYTVAAPTSGWPCSVTAR